MSETASNETMSTAEMVELQARYAVSGIVPSWGGQYPGNVAPARREGFKVWTPEGEELYDLHQAILCMSLGWAKPAIEKAVAEYRRTHPGCDMVDTTQLSEAGVLLARELVEALRPYGDFRALFAATGTGANNQALRLCMGALGGEDAVRLITMEGAYGGADLEMNSLCEVPGWKGVTSLESKALVVKRDGSNVDEVFGAIPKGVRPIWHVEDGQQGVGGFFSLDAHVMRYLAEEISRRDGLKIYDNVQAFGRNGAGLLGCDRWKEAGKKEHLPDAITFAKAMGNGRQIAAALVSERVLEAVRDSGKPGATFDTFSQGADGLVAAREVLRTVLRDKLWRNVSSMGARFKANLETVTERHPELVEAVVGEGGLIGIKFRTAEQVVAAMKHSTKNGVVFAKGGLAGEVVRLPLPLNADPQFVDEVSCRMESVFDDVRAAA